MITLSETLREDIRFETNYAHYFDSLMRINAPRFRSLGDDHCRAFVAHAAQVGDEMRFDNQGSISYLMFLMHWLGGYFHKDPRYTSVSDVLMSDMGEDERIEGAREAFMSLAERYIGERGEVFAERLAQMDTLETYLSDTTTSHHKLHDAMLDIWQLQGDRREAYPRDAIEGQAIASAAALDVDTPLGRRISLILTFVLGSMFHKDPLFPWVRDVVETARGDNAPADEALFAYAKKRMAATLRHAAAD